MSHIRTVPQLHWGQPACIAPPDVQALGGCSHQSQAAHGVLEPALVAVPVAVIDVHRGTVVQVRGINALSILCTELDAIFGIHNPLLVRPIHAGPHANGSTISGIPAQQVQAHVIQARLDGLVDGGKGPQIGGPLLVAVRVAIMNDEAHP